MKRAAVVVVTVLLASVGVWGQTFTALRGWANASGRTDGNGSVMTYARAYSGATGPYTNFGNLPVRTDGNGSLAVTVAGGTVTPDIVSVGDGTAALPSMTFTSDTTTGIWKSNTSAVGITSGTAPVVQFVNGGVSLALGQYLGFHSAATFASGSDDTTVTRAAAGVVKVSNGTAASTAEFQVSGGNGGFLSAVKALTELTTIAAAATTNTAIQIPVNAVVLGVSVRVVTIIPTAATFTVTSATPTKTWNTAAVTVAAGSTDPGTAPGPTFQTTASAITITPNLTPGTATGQVRVTIFYYQVTPATS